MAGKKRCKHHGGLALGYHWHIGLHEGRKRWVEGLHRLGLKAPNGQPVQHRRMMAMAKAIIAERRAEISSRQSSGMAGRLETVVLKGFDRIEQLLDQDAEDATTALRKVQSSLASELIRTQARLDDTALRSEREDRFLEIIERANLTLPPPEVDED